MPTRVGYAGTILAADLITAANNNKLPGGLVAYASTNTAVAGLGADTNLGSVAGLQVSYTPVNGTRSLLIMAAAPLFCETPVIPANQTQVNFAAINIYKDGASVGSDGMQGDDGHSHLLTPSYLDIAASAISHTYALWFLNVGAGLSSYRMNASGGAQAYIAVFDMGPSF